jgi:hypothetical protein
MPYPWPIHVGSPVGTDEPIGKPSDCELHATAIVRVNPNGATRAAPIQYP